MEKVAHRINEYTTRVRPTQGLRQLGGNKPQIEAKLDAPSLRGIAPSRSTSSDLIPERWCHWLLLPPGLSAEAAARAGAPGKPWESRGQLPMSGPARGALAAGLAPPRCGIAAHPQCASRQKVARKSQISSRQSALRCGAARPPTRQTSAFRAAISRLWGGCGKWLVGRFRTGVVCGAGLVSEETRVGGFGAEVFGEGSQVEFHGEGVNAGG